MPGRELLPKRNITHSPAPNGRLSKRKWVRNVRASGGKAVLRSGGREDVRLEEIPADQRAPILKAYLQTAAGARPHVPVDKDAPLAEFEKIAATIPVFRLGSNPKR